ncbi:hypothetical protein XENOCAPTIV_018076 [Xenoophorus captivus]|uniref:Uncharacterized protein n=1 Tax=Xenoophorus captivus TaxID=1517983 RepID=A0ABV0QIW7_9TELE
MSRLSYMPLNSRRGQLLNLTELVFKHRHLLQFSRQKEEEDAYFVDYIPPARDAINLPGNVVYVLAGAVLIIVATYAIVGHLIKDLMHDLAVEEDLEGEGAETEDKRRLSIFSNQMESGDELRMEKERERLLPGFLQRDGDCCRPSLPPPLRSAITSSYPGEKRMSTHSVTFACPVAPCVTSF